MAPQNVSDPLVRDAPVLAATTPVADAVRCLLDSDLPALPVLDERERLCGIFGQREFLAALFPGYLAALQSAGFVPRSLQSALDKRAACRTEPVRDHMNTEHIAVRTDYSDAQVAETFLHHRVLIIPVIDHHTIVGVITRADFFRAVAERFIATG
jgi:CBS-domain-containing membrane protein